MITKLMTSFNEVFFPWFFKVCHQKNPSFVRNLFTVSWLHLMSFCKGLNLRLLFSDEGVVAVPDADVGVVNPLQGGEGVGYGVADGEGPERRFPKTQIGQFMP